MGDGEHAAAGLRLIVLKSLPEILRIVSLKGREWQDLLRPFRSIAKDDDPMDVVAACVGRPLITDQRGEYAGVVVFLRSPDVLLPDRPDNFLRGQRSRERRLLPTLATISYACLSESVGCLAAQLLIF